MNVAIGHAGAFYYSGGCALATGSAECGAIFNVVHDDAARLGNIVYDLVNNSEFREGASSLLTEVTGHTNAAMSNNRNVAIAVSGFLGGRSVGAGVFGPLGVIAIPGGALQASQRYGRLLTFKKAVKGVLYGSDQNK